MVLNSVKNGSNTVIKPVKRPCKPVNEGKPAWRVSLGRFNQCVLLPLGSPTACPKRPHRAVTTAVRVVRQQGVPGWVWGTGWVGGRAIPGTTQPARCSRREVPVQRSGPRKPRHGAGVGGTGAGRTYLVFGGGDGSGTTTPARWAYGPASLSQDLRMPPLGQ